MTESSFSRLKLENFGPFRTFDVSLAPGINLFVGRNATGKTFLLKLLYAAAAAKNHGSFSDKLVAVFRPDNGAPSRLVTRQKGVIPCSLSFWRGRRKLEALFHRKTKSAREIKTTASRAWADGAGECAFVPVKETLENAPGFRSLSEKREISFDATYADIIDRAFLPPLKGPIDARRMKVLDLLGKAMEGRVLQETEAFYLKSPQGKLEFPLVSEGMRKLALIWLLIQNGTLTNGATLFWDEPEANLNPGKIPVIVEILATLKDMGVQVFVATHSYFVLKEFDLQIRGNDYIAFHALSVDRAARNIECATVRRYVDLPANAIDEAFERIYDRDVRQGFA